MNQNEAIERRCGSRVVGTELERVVKRKAVMTVVNLEKLL
jgi:hypothetical protein